MSDAVPKQAWLEKPDGTQLPVPGNLSFGRIAGNEVVLADERVSRRHAIVHSQGEAEFWLVDLGSRNGTYVNDRRVNLPVRLRDRDQIRISSFKFTFRQPGAGMSPGPATAFPSSAATLIDVRTAPCWLLVADVQGSTALSQATWPEDLAVEMGQWFLHCQQLIESGRGTLNKYLGDGFLAFWPSSLAGTPALVTFLNALRDLQETGKPDFRFVLHYGDVRMGGGGSLGEESLSGPAVNFVFRMEKLAGGLGQRRLLSAEAAQRLQGSVPTEAIGEHSLDGFEGRFSFFNPWP